jgi:hypothetical protein
MKTVTTHLFRLMGIAYVLDLHMTPLLTLVTQHIAELERNWSQLSLSDRTEIEQSWAQLSLTHNAIRKGVEYIRNMREGLGQIRNAQSNTEKIALALERIRVNAKRLIGLLVKSSLDDLTV